MTLLDAQTPKTPKPIGKYILLTLVVALLVGGAAYWFWDYPEEHAVSRFLSTVESGDYKTAYQLWKPVQSYTYEDFVKDWGPGGDYGKIRDFNILDANSAARDTVTVTVSINGVSPPLRLLVDKSTKGLAFSPFSQ